jgi:hypothetical protein
MTGEVILALQKDAAPHYSLRWHAVVVLIFCFKKGVWKHGTYEVEMHCIALFAMAYKGRCFVLHCVPEDAGIAGAMVCLWDEYHIPPPSRAGSRV